VYSSKKINVYSCFAFVFVSMASVQCVIHTTLVIILLLFHKLDILSNINEHT